MPQSSLTHIRLWSQLALALLVVLSLSSCVVPEALIVQPPPATPPVPAPLLATEHLDPNLAAALAHSPTFGELFSFTNWAMLKREVGMPDVNSEDSIDERIAMVSAWADGDYPVFNIFGSIGSLRLHAENWGWDFTDLLWHTSIIHDGTPLHLLQFRDDLDFAPFLARLDEHGYTVTDHLGTRVYGQRIDFDADWQRTTELAMLNVAFLEAENILVLSSSQEPVIKTLDAIAQREILAHLPAVQAVAAELGETGVALVSPFGCQPLQRHPDMHPSPDVSGERLEQTDLSGISGDYSAFALGYRVETRKSEKIPVGVFAYYYPVAAQAEADLEPRRLLAESGTNAANVPYTELFEVIDAKVADANTSGATLLLSLHTLEEPTHLFFGMYYRRDLLFSTCGAG